MSQEKPEDTRRLNGGGQDRKLDPERSEPNVPKAAESAPVKTQTVFDMGDHSRLWQRVTDLGRMLERSKTNAIAAIVASAMLVFIPLVVLVSRQQTNFDERLAAQRKDSEAYREAMEKQLQEFLWAFERLAVDVDENRKATAAALTTPAVTLDPEDFRNRTTRSHCYYGWSIVRMFDDLEVIHLRWDRELYEKYDNTQGDWYDPGEADQYIHFGRELYECAKYQQRESSDWVDVRGRLWGFVQAVHGEVAAFESIRNLDHCAITEHYDAERVIGVRYGGPEKITLYRRFDDTSYALAKEMKTLDVWKLKEAQRASKKMEPENERSCESAAGERAADFTNPKPATLAELRQYDGEEILSMGEVGTKRWGDPSPVVMTYNIMVNHLPYAYGKRVRVLLRLSAEDYALAKNWRKLDVQALENARRNR